MPATGVAATGGTGAKAKKQGRKKKILDPLAVEKQRAAEAEANRRQLIMREAKLQEIVDAERIMTQDAMQAVEARWMAFLRQCKQKELVANIEVSRRTFAQALERENALIAQLLSDLAEVEDQYRHAFRSNMEVVDSLIEQQNNHTDNLHKEFEADLLEMKGDFALERAELEKNHQLELADLNLILQNMAAEAEKLEKKLQEETLESYETAVEKMDEEKKHMEANLTYTSENVRSELDSRYKEFMATAQVNMKDYMDKSKEDQETTDRIASQLKKIDKLQESVAFWRSNISRNAREWEERNVAMRSEKETTSMHLKKLKEKMQRWRAQQSHKLADLVRNANASETALDQVAKKAERILRLVELCKPLETEREQILDFEANQSPGEIEQDVQRRIAASEPGALEAAAKTQQSSNGAASCFGVSSEWQVLERFWTKYNKVMLDCAAVAQEREHLERESSQLQSILKQYLNDVSVNDDVMRNSNNTLLRTKPAPNVVQMANQSGNAAMRGQAYQNVVVDGNKFVADVSRQAARR